MSEEIELKLKNAGLRVTPQRVAVLRILLDLDSHPAMEDVIELVQKENSHISTGTIYRIVDQLFEKGVIGKVKTRSGLMRIDSENRHHHHLVNSDESRIEDYHDAELDALLREHFSKKGIENFDIDRISVEIQGKFVDERD